LIHGRFDILISSYDFSFLHFVGQKCLHDKDVHQLLSEIFPECFLFVGRHLFFDKLEFFFDRLIQFGLGHMFSVNRDGEIACRNVLGSRISNRRGLSCIQTFNTVCTNCVLRTFFGIRTTGSHDKNKQNKNYGPF
jgi:hypothetical protein